MKEKLPFVSVVIASFNRKYIIEESISSALNQDYPKEDFEVIVVDNNSTDGTVNEVLKVFPNEIKKGRLKLVPLTYNSGSSGSYVEALFHLNPKWQYLLKMDEDIILDKSCVKQLILPTLSSKKIGMVGGKVLFYKNRDTIQAIGSRLKPRYAISKGIGSNQKDKGQYDSELIMEGLAGCMLLISRELQEDIGWFDTDYFLYYDDHDLMFRSLKKGYKHIFSPGAVGFHDTETGSKKKYSNRLWLYYSIRGSYLFLFKNFKVYNFGFWVYFFSHNLKFLFGLAYIFLYSRRSYWKANLSVFFKGYFHGLIQKKGYYDLEKKGLRVVILSGGRGSGNLSNGIRSFARKKNMNIEVVHVTNAYDDGKSTGEVRRFFKNSILGPSDVRKIQQNQYSFLYSDPSISDFFSLRLDGNKDKILEELNCISLDKKPETNILYESFLRLPLDLKEVVLESLKHFFKKDYKKIDLSDFAFSNLVYACLADKYGNLQSSEEIMRRVLKLPDPVLLNSLENGYIFGLTEAGELLYDEASIVDYSKVSPIYEVYYSNEPISESLIKEFSTLKNFEEKKFYLSSKYSDFPPLSKKAEEAIEHADILIYGPGTQYSSLYPTYFTKGFAKKLKKARAIRIFICNVYHDSETPGFSAVDQIRQATFYLNMKGKFMNTERDFFDVVIANDPKELKQKYIMPNRTELEQLDIRNIHIQDIESDSDGGFHDSNKISNIIFNIYNSRWR